MAGENEEGIFTPMSEDMTPDQTRPSEASTRSTAGRRTSAGAGPTEGAESAAPAFADAGHSLGSDPASDAKRRRGSRGGRKRHRSEGGGDARHGSDGGETVVVSEQQASEYARRPADLPDSPFEGVPSAAAAVRATVTPKIGDSRPAPDAAGRPGGRPGRAARTVRDSAEIAANPNGKVAKRPATVSADVRGANSVSKRANDNTADAADSASESGDVSGGADGEGRRGRRRRGETADKPARPEKVARERPGRGQKGRGADTRLAQSEEEIAERRRGRERNGKPVGRYLMCVHSHPKATQIAVLEGRSLIEHYVSKPSDQVAEIHGNIYVGKVQNVLPGMEAAFVDISTPKNAVLYRGDLQFDTSDIDSGGSKGSKARRDDVRIEQVLKNGQLVLCQVTKNPIGSKGARLTQEVSIPGRFVVLIPNSDTYGISKRLPDDERKRLRRILDEVRPAGHGLIVRTAADGATEDELRRDVQLLSRQWDAIDAKAKKAKGPVLLYKEPDMAVRVIREEFNRNYRGIVLDNRELYEEVRSYVESITPELADRVEFHDPASEPLPLFERHHVHEQVHKAIDRKVWLPSGGSLIIERTEALTVIDVNTGKNVGSSSLEETVFRNNLEAAAEIARQLRLRDIGGIIVIDFIDMETRPNREAVVTAFREALSRDKTRTQVFDISELGLVEMTRKRISEGLVESLSTLCPTCEGRGFTFDADLMAE